MNKKIEELEKQIEALRKINRVLMERVERSIDMSSGDFALFEYNIHLQRFIDERTSELEKANAKLTNLLEEQRRITKYLSESEERYRLIFEQSRDATMTLEPPEWKFTSYNPAFCDMFRIDDPNSFTQLTPWDISPEHQPDGHESRKKAIEMIEKAMREGYHFFEWTHRRFDGEEFPVTVLLTRIEMAGKTFLHATFRDITTQKLAERELIDRENRANRQRSAIASLAFAEPISAGNVAIAIQQIVETMSHVLQVERASVWILSQDNTELRCLSLYEASKGKHSGGMILKTSEFPSYFEAMLSESRISASDARSDPRTRELTEGYFEELGITSLLDAGILIEGKLIGVVSAEHVGKARAWHIDEEAFVSTMAALAAQVFINNKKKEIEKDLLIFKESLENSSDAIAMATPEGRHYYQNKAFNEIFGNIGDDPSIVYVDKKDAKSVFETIMRGERWEGEIKMFDKEKNIRDIFLRAYANKDDTGQITALVGIHTDITTRKQMFDALRESERMYATLIENLPGFAYRCKNDRDWTMEYISVGCLPITGYSPEDFINNYRISYNDIIHPDWQEKLWDIWQEKLPKREFVQVEYPIICADGSQRWVAEIAAKIREVLG